MDAIDVMICYAAADRPRASALAGECRAQGLSVFLDLDLQPGDRWDRQLPQALDRAETIAFLITERWHADTTGRCSWYGPAEVARSIMRRRERGDVRVVPVLADAGAVLPYGFEHLVPLSVDAQGMAGVARRLKRLCAGDAIPPPVGWEPSSPAISLDLPIELLEELADRFPERAIVRSMWTRAGGRVRRVPAIADPFALWQYLWRFARNGAPARPETLLEIALRELPHNACFRRHREALRSED